jgi:molecular chaperone GrpE (heat shock protein)
MSYYNHDWYYTAGPEVAEYEPTTYNQEVYDLAKKLGSMTAEQCLAVADALIAANRYYDTDKDGDEMAEALEYVERRLDTKIGGA